MTNALFFEDTDDMKHNGSLFNDAGNCTDGSNKSLETAASLTRYDTAE